MKYLNHYWRLIGTALSFAVFGVAGLFMGLVLFPLMSLFMTDRERRRVCVRALIGRAFGLFVGIMRFLGVMDYRIRGEEYRAASGNCLIIANHPTLIDVVILISLFPQSNCVIKEAVTRNPFMRSVAGAADYISNSEPEELLNTCSVCLRDGGSLMLFPEGTRSRAGDDLRFKPGAATVAARSGVAILPIAIQCRPVFLNKEVPWHYVPPERPLFTIRILPPVAVADLVNIDSNERDLRTNLNQALLEIIAGELSDMEARSATGKQPLGA